MGIPEEDLTTVGFEIRGSSSGEMLNVYSMVRMGDGSVKSTAGSLGDVEWNDKICAVIPEQETQQILEPETRTAASSFKKKVYLVPSIEDKRMSCANCDPTWKRVCGGGFEGEYQTIIAQKVKDRLSILYDVQIFDGADCYSDCSGSCPPKAWYKCQSGIGQKANNWGADVLVSFHTNATAGGCNIAATGTIAFYECTSTDYNLAQKIYNAVVNSLKPLRDEKQIIAPNNRIEHWWDTNYRPCSRNTTSKCENSVPNVGCNYPDWYTATMPACLIESLFHDNLKESEILRSVEGQEAIAQGIASGIMEFFGDTPQCSSGRFKVGDCVRAKENAWVRGGDSCTNPPTCPPICKNLSNGDTGTVKDCGVYDGKLWWKIHWNTGGCTGISGWSADEQPKGTGWIEKITCPNNLPNLTPYQPSGWSDKIVVSKTTGTNIDSSPLYTTDTLYVDWAVINNGTGAVTDSFGINLYVDGDERFVWPIIDSLDPNGYRHILDHNIGTLSAGTHYIKIVADVTGAVQESNESDNEYTKTITVQSPAGVLSVTPSDGLTSSGNQGGPFTLSGKSYTLQNTGGSSINWMASKGQGWVTLSSTSGTLVAGASTTVTVSINSNANSLTPGTYNDTVSFTNTTNGNGNTTRPLSLTVTYQPETVSTPNTPSGPTSGEVGTIYTYSTGGATSNLGDSVQYQFNWGDGIYSDWSSSPSASKRWSSSGTYVVKAQARCATHTDKMSNESQELLVSIQTNVTTRTLTVASSNPDSGTNITVSPGDNHGQGSDMTPFTRTYDDGTEVTLSAPTTAGGNNFKKWQRDGVDFSTNPITVKMDADYTMTAVYEASEWITNDANGHLYKLINGGTWYECEDNAVSQGAHLVTINDADEQNWLTTTFGVDKRHWIGFTDKDEEENWRWISGESPTYTNWMSGEPNDWLGCEDYAVINWATDGKWNDLGDCVPEWSEVKTAIIEKSAITPPEVISTSPVEDAKAVAVDTVIAATFSEEMDASTITTSTFTLNNGATGTVSYNNAARTATFDPSTDLDYSITYTATITTGVKDSTGNAMTSSYTWSFTTVASPVNITSFSINNGTSSTTSQTVTLNNTTTGNPTEYMASESSAFTSATWQTYSTAPNFTLSAGNGDKTVYFKVKNANGESAVVSDNIVLNSVLDTTAPEVSSTVPTTDATNVPVDSAVTATFSEAMDIATITNATFIVNGATGIVTYSGMTATFAPTSDLAYGTIYTATITTGVMDLSGNAMISNYTWSFTTTPAPDTTPPEISSTNPPDGATTVAVTDVITANFSEKMDAATINTTTFIVNDGSNNIDGTVDYSNMTATFTPSSPLAYSTTYTATITIGVTDEAGNAMTSDYTWGFSTGNDIIAHYTFNEGTGNIAHDSSDNGNDGIINGATWKPGKEGGGLSFDGVNDYVTIPLMNNGEVSVSAWFNKIADDKRRNDAIFSGFRNNSNLQLRQGLELRFPAGVPNTLEFVLVTQDGSGAKTTRTTRRNLLNAVGSWYHAVGTYNKATGQQRLYINGELVNTVAHPAGNTVVPLTFYPDMRIGHSRVNNGYFNGVIDDVLLYSRAITDQEVNGLYHAFTSELQAQYNLDEGMGTIAGDSSGNGNHGRINGGAKWTTGRYGGGLKFDGTNDSVSIPRGNHDEVSVCAWFKKKANDKTRNDAIFGGYRNNSNVQLREGFDVRFPSNAPNFLQFVLVTQDGSGLMTMKTAQWNLGNSVGRWHHLAGTYNKATGEQRLYVDGQLVNTQTHPAGNTIVPLTKYPDMRIGYSRVNAGYFKGVIDDARIYNRALTAQEVLDIYNNP